MTQVRQGLLLERSAACFPEGREQAALTRGGGRRGREGRGVDREEEAERWTCRFDCRDLALGGTL